MLDALQPATVRRWAVVTRAALAARREQIDALNVFPVDDGDTGTNLYLTFDGALDALRGTGASPDVPVGNSVVEECISLARVSLFTARGNSGVIFSQLIRGFADVLATLEDGAVDAAAVTACLAGAAERGRAAVTHPVEGTVLTVADATAAAAAAAGQGITLGQLTETCVRAAAAALDATTDQLDVLARAGVVDAGGAGYLLFVEALDRIVRDITPRTPYAVDAVLGTTRRRGRPSPSAGTAASSGRAGRAVTGTVTEPRGAGDPAVSGRRCEVDGPAAGAAAEASDTSYEVMYLLDEATSDSVATLTGTLDGLGDSLLVVGGPDIWNVHVHTSEVGPAIEAGVVAGRPHRIRVTGLTRHPAESGAEQGVGSGVVACAAGPGLEVLFEDAGAVTVPSGPRRRASAGELLQAVRSTGGPDVILLPNDHDTLMSAQAAARAAADEGVHVHVVPSITAVQGVAALAVHDASLPVERDALAMAAAAASTRHGALTIAVKAGLTSGGPCVVGDVLGVVNGDIDIVGSDRVEVATEVLTRLLGGGGELVTVLVGADAPEGLADAVVAAVHDLRREVEVHVIDGGQPHYDLLIGVE